MAKKEQPTKPRGKQDALPGMEPKDIPEVTAAAELYETKRDARIKATDEETETREGLLEVMAKHKLDHYRSPEGLYVSLKKGKVKVKVQRIAVAESEAA